MNKRFNRITLIGSFLQLEISWDSISHLDINNEASYKEIINHLYKQEDNEGRTLYDMFDTLPSREVSVCRNEDSILNL